MQNNDSQHPSLNFTSPAQVTHSAAKRLFDIFFSLFILLLLSPLMLLIFCLVALSSPGKTIYSQTRIGRGGKPFKCYKFRTMYSDADHRLQEILTNNAEMRIEWEKLFKLKNDPRTTPIGKFLRQTSLDELPQFWNVLVGDLSVVGPRPVVAKELETYFREKSEKILSVRPGVTGLWQVSGRSDTSYEARVRMDEEYVDTRSLWMDVQLVFKTVYCLIYRKGAY